MVSSLGAHQSQPGPQGADWDEKRLSGGKAPSGASEEKCIQEDLLAAQLVPGRSKRSSTHSSGVTFPCRGARVGGVVPQVPLPAAHQLDQVILDALVNPQAALTGEETFHLADSVDQASGRYAGLRPQEASSTQLPTLNSLVVKNEVALQQLEADRAARAATTSPPQPQPALRQLVDQVQPHRLLMEGRLQPLAPGMWCLPRQSHLQNLSYPRALLHQ